MPVCITLGFGAADFVRLSSCHSYVQLTIDKCPPNIASDLCMSVTFCQERNTCVVLIHVINCILFLYFQSHQRTDLPEENQVRNSRCFDNNLKF